MDKGSCILLGLTSIFLIISSVLSGLTPLLTTAQNQGIGQAQSNVIYCTRGVTCYGTNGPDFILGTALDDTIASYAGNDRIYGKGGNDEVHSGVGNDIVYGDAGADVIVAGIGNDKVYGGYGGDRIYGGTGLDDLWGEEGNDKIYQNSYPSYPDGSFDSIYCGLGDDRVWKENTYDEDAKLNGDPYYEDVVGCEVINGYRLGR